MPKVSDSHLEARRQQILAAAMICIGNKGIGGTSMQDIFNESGLSPGAVYRYFRSKQEIIEAAVKSGAEQTAEAFRATQQVEDPGLALDGFAHASFSRIGAPGAEPLLRAGIAIMAEATTNETVAKPYRAMVDALVGAMTEAVTAMQRNGQAPAHLDPHYVGRVLYAIYEGCISQKLLYPDLDVEEFVNTMIGILSFEKPPGSTEP